MTDSKKFMAHYLGEFMPEPTDAEVMARFKGAVVFALDPSLPKDHNVLKIIHALLDEHEAVNTILHGRDPHADDIAQYQVLRKANKKVMALLRGEMG